MNRKVYITINLPIWLWLLIFFAIGCYYADFNPWTWIEGRV